MKIGQRLIGDRARDPRAAVDRVAAVPLVLFRERLILHDVSIVLQAAHEGKVLAILQRLAEQLDALVPPSSSAAAGRTARAGHAATIDEPPDPALEMATPSVPLFAGVRRAAIALGAVLSVR